MTASQRSRALLLTASLAALVVLVWRGTAGDRATALGPAPTLVELVTVLAGVAVLLALSWLTLLTALLALERGAGRNLTARAGCPAALRRVLLVLCGVAVAGAMAVPAQAADDPGPSSPAARGGAELSARLDGLPMPDRPTGGAPGGTPAPAPISTPTAAPPAAHTSAPRASSTAPPSTTAEPRASDRGRSARAPQPAAADGTVTAGTPHASGTPSATGEDTVRPGDSLWAVARRHLPPDAGPAEISRAWTAIYDANRDVVGGDPDLIHPGTDLRLPPTSEENQP